MAQDQIFFQVEVKIPDTNELVKYDEGKSFLISCQDFIPSFYSKLLFIETKEQGVEYVFKINNKDTRTTPMASFWCIYC